MKRINSLLISAFTLWSFFTNAQLPVFDEIEILKFAGEAKAIVLDRTEKVKISFSKGKPVILVEHSDHILYLSESSMAGQKFEIPYSDKFFTLEKIEACTYVKRDKGYSKVKAGPPVYTSKIADGLFYDDMKQAGITFPSVEKFSITELKYTHKILDPLFVFPFYFKPADAFPLIRSSFRIEFDQNFDVDMLMFGDTSNIKSMSGSNGKIIWKEKILEKQPAYKYNENAPSSAYYRPHLHYLIKSYKDKSEKIEYLGTVQQLYQRNYEYIKDFNSEACSKALKTVTDSIRETVEGKDSLEVIEQVLYWIQDHIRYVAIEDGLSGYIPRPSNAVFDKRYGDCKDMASLMQYMLKECGIESNLAWIGTRDIPYTYNELPISQNSNHMILAKKINGEWMFFDPTADGLKSFLPSSFIQGKEAMIAIDENRFEIATVPIIEHGVNFITDTMSGKLSRDGDIELFGKISFGGLARWRIKAIYEGYDEKNKKEFIEAIIKHEYDKANVLEYEIRNANDRNAPFEISYKAEFPDFAKVIDNEIYLNPNLRKPLMNEKIKHERGSIPVEYMFKYADVLSFEIELPDQTSLSSIPAQINFSNDLIEFQHKISTEQNKVNILSAVILKSIFVESPQFEQWNSSVKEINKSFRESLVIAKQN